MRNIDEFRIYYIAFLVLTGILIINLAQNQTFKSF